VARPDWIVVVAFSLLIIVSLLNLNGLAAMVFGLERAFSVVYLIGTGIIILRLWHRRFYLSTPIRLYLWFMGSYIVFGCAASTDSELLLGYMPSAVASVTITLSAYLASLAAFSTFGVAYVVFRLTIILSAAAATVFLTPYFADVVYVHIENLAWTVEGRASGVFANPNETGMAACYAIAFAIGGIELFSSKRIRLMLWGMTAVSIVAVIMSFSRTAIAIAFVMLVVFMLRSMRNAGRSALPVLTGAALVLVGGWFLLEGWREFNWSPGQAQRLGSFERILRGGAELGHDDSHRLEASTVGLKHWLERPFFGHGLADGQSLRELGDTGSHNTYLLILGDAGIVPFFFFVAMIFAFWTSTRYARDCGNVAIAEYFGISFVMAALANHNLLNNRSINVLTGVIMALLALSETARMRRGIPHAGIDAKLKADRYVA
jgi:hypothetical protein